MDDILLLAPAFPPAIGGIQTYSYEVARSYATIGGGRVIVLTQAPGTRCVARRDGVVVINVGPGPQVVVFARMLGALWRLRQWRRGRKRFAFVHATTWRVAAPAAVFSWDGPLVVTIMGREVLSVARVLRPAVRWVLHRAAAVVCISRSAQRAARCEGPKSLVAFPGLSSTLGTAARVHPCDHASDRTVVILTLCRLVERKNVLRALEAVALLKRRGVGGFRYLIAGDGPLFERIHASVLALGLVEQVQMLGAVPDTRVAGLYTQAAVFLHPQVAADGGRDFEGFGLAVADAMSFGVVPIVGIDGGPAEYVRDGQTGLLVDGRDVAAIADAIERLLHDRGERARMARAAREWAVRELSWEQHARAIVVKAIASVSGSGK